MGKGSDINFPDQPDGAALAQQQGQNNLEAAIATSLLNQVGENTPYGSVNYTPSGATTRIGGYNVPSFTRNVNLTPQAQAQLDAQQATSMNLAQLGQENIGRVRGAQEANLNFQGLPDMVSGINAAPISGFQAPGQEVSSSLQEFDPLAASGLFGIGGDFAQQGSDLERATFDRGMSLLEPQFGRQMEEAEVRMSERGLPLSSQIGQNILGGVQTARGRQMNELALASVQAGRQEQERLANQSMRVRGQQFGELMGRGQFGQQAQQQAFGQSLAGQQAANAAQQLSYNQAAGNAQLQNAARQGGFQERSYLRNMPLNDIAALMGQAGGVQLPQFQQMPNVAVQSGDLIGATLGAQQNALQQAQIQQQAKSSMMGGLFDLAGSVGGAAIMASDIRVKDDIERIGLVNGIPLYKFRYKGQDEETIGVMAQEVEQIIQIGRAHV